MRDVLTPLILLQRFMIPALLILLAWALWKTLFKKDFAVGLGLYVSLVVVVDGFYNTGIYIPGFEVGSIRYSEVCALFLLFIRPRVDENRIVGSQGPVLFLAAAYFLLMFVAALRAQPMSAGIFEFRRIIVPQILTFMLALRGLGTSADYRRFLLCVVVLVLLTGIFCFWDVFFDRAILHSDMLFKPEYSHNRRLGRFGSIFLNPNLLGAFVVLFFPPLFILTLNERKRWTRLFFGSALLALTFCLVETQSRGPLIAFGVALMVLLFGPVGGMSRRRRFGFLLLFLVVFAALMPGFLQRSTERFDVIDNEESADQRSRYTVWQYTLRIIGEHPVGGIGFGERQFLNAMADTDFQERFGEASLDNPHNSYLQIAVYAGLPALAVFVFLNLLLLMKSMSAAWRATTRGIETATIFGLAVGVTAFLASIYPDMHLFTQNVAPLYWLFFGLLLALVSQKPAPANGSPGSNPPQLRSSTPYRRMARRSAKGASN